MEVLAGATLPDRSREAMDSTERVNRNLSSEMLERPAPSSSSRPSTDLLGEIEGGIPVVDLASLQDGDREATSKKVARACETWGCFLVVNHGIPSSLLRKVKKIATIFLSPALAETISVDLPHSRTLDVSENTLLDWVDALLHYFAPSSPSSSRDMEFWPPKTTDYREIMDSYRTEMHRLVGIFLAILSVALGMDASFLEDACGGERAEVSVRLQCSPRREAHSVAGCIAIVLQDEAEGMQIARNGRGIGVPSLPDAIAVFLGKRMEVLSKGKYKSVELDEGYISIATFYATEITSSVKAAT